MDTQPRGIAARMGAWSAANRKKAIFGWFALIIIATVLGGAVGTRQLEEVELGNGQSKVADRAVEAAGFPEETEEQVLVQGRGSVRATDPAFRAAVQDVAQRLAAVPGVGAVVTPEDDGAAGLRSRDGRSALVTAMLPGASEDVEDAVDATLAATAAAQRAHPSVRIEQFGGGSATKALNDALKEDFQRAEVLSLPITLVILVVAFGALVAAGLPLLLGVTAVAGAIGLLGPLSQLHAIGGEVSSVILLIGLAVGVDYSMFYLRREMEERDAGRAPQAALAAAAATSGRAVLVSGLTVMIAMAGMFFAGNAQFVSFALGTILVVAIAMLGSLTFLPAMLSWLGQKGWTEKGRVPYLGRLRHRRPEGSRVWGAVLDRVLRRPAVAALLAGGLLVGLTLPALGLKTINTGIQGLPRDLAVMQTYDRMQAAFPGDQIPGAVVVRADDVTAPAVRSGIERLGRAAAATGHTTDAVDVRVNPSRTLAVVSIPFAGSGTDAASNRALDALRNEVVPATIARVPGVQAQVTGITAQSRDFSDSMQAHLPIVFAFVLGLAFLLLLVTFRSLVVPVKALVLNLLSVGASYGVLKLVFQDGHGEGLLGFQSLGGVAAWLPLFLFVILFGLSMDYHVFILSRIREGVDRGMGTERAIAHGIKSTAGVVTSAAVVMVAVFAIFATLSQIDMKMMGVGLAVAVLIDATIVRAVLLPATMQLLGDRNWYLPPWLAWLPHVHHEGFVPAPQPALVEEPADEQRVATPA
jgi:RND superfamily putative drug exporter